MRALFSLMATTVVGIFLAACEHYSPTPPPLDQVEAEIDAVVNEREIVVLAQTRDQFDQLVFKSRPKGYQLVRREALPSTGFHLGVLLIPEGVNPAVAIRELEAMVAGISAGVNHAYVSSQSSSRSVNGRRYADAMLGWPAEGCTARRAIGIVDAAIDFNDPALARVRGVTRVFVDEAAQTDHATAMAVIAAGNNRLHNVSIYNAVVVGVSSQGQNSAGVDAIVRAIDWLLANDVKLANVSLEGPYNRILERSVQRAAAKGMVFVASAGNSGPQATPRFPASFAEVIAVTAVDAQEQPFASAGRGAHIDFSAPGVDIFVSMANADRYVSGTSFATVLATGALAAEADTPRFSHQWAFSAIAAGARDLGSLGRDPIFGEGLIQVSPECRGRG